MKKEEWEITLLLNLANGDYDDNHWEIQEEYLIVNSDYSFWLNELDGSIDDRYRDNAEPLAEIQSMYLKIFEEFM